MGRYSDVDYMKGKLKEWHPTWNVDAWNSKKIMAVYRSETQKMVPKILDALGYQPKYTANSNLN